MRSLNNILIIAFLWATIFTGEGLAQITGGKCKDCHTMHYAQILGGTPSRPARLAVRQAIQIRGLTVKDCIGCHSSQGSETIVHNTPIVYNTAYPTKPLAGGNFYWVAQGPAYDQMGHNVYKICDVDSRLTEAPGNDENCAGCHLSLATDPANNTLNRNGCEGCHIEVSHHNQRWYRFLVGCKGESYYVKGIGDENWEQNPTLQNHNIYQGADELGGTLNTTHSISAFCAGCHGKFHGDQEDVGSGSPWIRHPTDIVLPQAGEYGGYTSYSTQAPVAYKNLSSPSRSEAVVMCLSCHRAHGSDQANILRWTYDESQWEGCLTCHTQK